MTGDLFGDGASPDAFGEEGGQGATLKPLADRMRPRNVAEVLGQQHLLGAGKPLRQAIEAGRLHSMVFWGPPGTGKTTLGRLIARHADARFATLSAVLSGVKDIRAAVDEARLVRQRDGRATVLFVDEVHRFNKAQQDAFLPHIEDGTVTFVGATTENPSFELNNALLSRARVYVLKSLDEADVRVAIERALADEERGLGARRLTLAEETLAMLARSADGDCRRALNLLEMAADLAADGDTIDTELLGGVLAGGSARRFDRAGDAFFDQISALHKSVRGSSPDGALYWLARMIDGGCDPFYIARRVLRMASEDIGNADPRGLQLAIDAWQALERLGSPEGELALAQAVVYLACAPKSDAVYKAFGAAVEDVRAGGSAEVPMHLRNAPTRLMQGLGHGEGYRHAHDEADGYAPGVRFFPDGVQPRRYYQPVSRGLEIRIAERLAELRARDREFTGEDN